jgi:initiation factor 1A
MKKSNQTGGKNHKKYKKNNTVEVEHKLLLADQYQVYAIVQKKLGGTRVSVLCSDDIIRSAIIPGKFYKKVYMNENDIVLCDLNKGGDDKQCYITHKYYPKDATKLKHLGHITFENVGEFQQTHQEEAKLSHRDMFPPSSSEEDMIDNDINHDHSYDISDEISSESIDLGKL